MGLTRLHGLEDENGSPYAIQIFLSIVTILSILTIGLVRLPTTKAVPAYLFLLMQIMGICKEFDNVGRVRDAPFMIFYMVVAGICMYFGSRRFDSHMERDTTELTKEAIAIDEMENDES